MDQRGQLVLRDPPVGRVQLGETARWAREDALAQQALLVQWDRAVCREPMAVRVRLARRDRPVLRVQPVLRALWVRQGPREQPAPQEPWDPQVRLARPVLLVLLVVPPAQRAPQVQPARPARQVPQA